MEKEPRYGEQPEQYEVLEYIRPEHLEKIREAFDRAGIKGALEQMERLWIGNKIDQKEIIKWLTRRQLDFLPDPTELRSALDHTKEIMRGVSTPCITYPSGLTLIFYPIYDGRPSLETFCGTYHAELIIPTKYDPAGKKYHLPLNAGTIAKILSPATKNLAKFPSDLEFTFSDRFACGYESEIFKKWFVLVNFEKLQQSEQNIFGILHELSHVYDLDMEDRLVRQACESKNAEDLIAYDEAIMGASGYITAIRNDLKKLQKIDPELLNTIYREVSQLPEEYRPARTSILLLSIFEPALGHDQRQQLIYSLLTKLTIFHEQSANTKAAMMYFYLRENENGGVTLNFSSSKQVMNLYHEALETYAKGRQEPHFHKSFSAESREAWDGVKAIRSRLLIIQEISSIFGEKLMEILKEQDCLQPPIETTKKN